MPPKKRGGRSVGSVKAKLGTQARKNKNITSNSRPVLSFDVLTEVVESPSGVSTRKVTATANNEMQIKLSTGAVESNVGETMPVADNSPKRLRITRNNCLKARLREENDMDTDIKTDSPSNAQAVDTTPRQRDKNIPAARKRKLVRNDSIDWNDSYVVTKRQCRNKRALNENNINVRKETVAKNRKTSKNKVVNDKQSSVSVAQTAEGFSKSPRKVIEVRNKESFNFEVTISSRAEAAAAVEPVKTSTPSECLSWTKDISSSSTVTCVTVESDDVVRASNKVPVVRLTDVGDLVFNTDFGNHDSEFVASGESVSKSKDTIANDVEKASSSSSSPSSSSSSTSSDRYRIPDGYQSADDEIDKALEKLTTEFKKKDMEIIDWIACENTKESLALQNVRKRVCKALPEESEVIAHCRALKNLLIRDYEDLLSDIAPRRNNEEAERLSGGEFLKPQDIRKVIRRDNANDPPSKGFGDDKERGGMDRRPEDSTGLVDDRANDDDDALSLFAESITGLDSSRKNDSLPTQAPQAVVGDSGQYVPQPISNNKKNETITYRPTHISKQNTEESPHNETVKMACEKQNADSSSICREIWNYCDNIGVEDGGEGRCPAAPQEPDASPTAPSTTPPTAPPTIPPTTPPNARPNRTGRPLFIADMYTQPRKFQSHVFLGICFFKVAFKCTRDRCQFRHTDLDVPTVVDRLARLDGDVLFIQEYMIMRKWASLWTKYGLLFVLEGIRRKLTGVVLEMAIDFTRKANVNQPEEKALAVKIQEAILLYMNTVDIFEHGEILNFPVTERSMLYDIFMKSLASTQNISRFKTVFINLTNFIDRIPGEFSFDVASSLLERVCILPHDVSTAKAMLIIMRRTSSKIFENSMIGLFEQQLSANEDLCREFEMLKRVAVAQAEAEAWTTAGARSTPVGPRCIFSPEHTGPSLARTMTEHAIASQLVDTFNKLGEGRWAGASTPRRPCAPVLGAMTAPSIAFIANRQRATPLMRPPRPFPRNRPNYPKRFVQNS